MQAEQNDTFDLDIVFVGLCMLVKDGKRLHALLPETSGMHEHEALLFIHPAYSSGLGNPNTPMPTTPIDLKNRQLDLTLLKTTDTLDPNFGKSNVFDLGDFVAREVPRKFLDIGDITTEPNDCASRVTLAVGSVAKRKRGSIWKITRMKPSIKEYKGHMAITVRWRIKDVEGVSITLQLKALNKNGSDKPVPLFAIGRRIEIFVYHSMPKNLPVLVPPKPIDATKPDDGKAAHFGEFYRLLPKVPDAPVPELVDLDKVNKPTHETDPEPRVIESPLGAQDTAWREPAVEFGAGGEAGCHSPSSTSAPDRAGELPHHGEHGTAGTSAGVSAAALSGDEVACIVVTAPAATA